MRAQSLAGMQTTTLGVGSLVARAYLTVVAGLVFWSLAPALFGLHPFVVQTGSMQPAIRPGDVILVQHLPAAEVRPGQVVLADDPGHPGLLLSHRVVRRNPDGTLVTRGDANRTPDSTPILPSQVHGVARLRVPDVGLPSLWWRDGNRRAAFAWLFLTCVGIAMVGGPASSSVRSHSQLRRRSRIAAAVPASGLAMVLALRGLTSTRQETSQWLTPRPACRRFTATPVSMTAAVGEPR